MTSHAAHITVGRPRHQLDLLAWIAETVRAAFRADPGPDPAPPPRRQTRRDEFIEDAAMRREMFRL